MTVSHILPTDLLYLIENRPFYMCLANIASKNNNYLNFYKKQKENGSFILLDNGAAESDQMSLDIMWDIIKEINPNEIILNDVMTNREATIEQSTISLDYYKSIGYKGQYMYVAHGINYTDWLKNFEYKRFLSNIHTIGVPKIISWLWSKTSNNRYKCCKYLSDKKFNIHLLGCNEPINNITQINRDLNVRSIDTALSYLCTKDSIYLSDFKQRSSTQMDFYKSELGQDGINLLQENIKYFDESLKLCT